ncbi:hypothetical protein MY11210_009464 [Beauveria gryllotalpidicola]
MRPIVVAALFAAASNSQSLGLFDTVLPGHGPEQSSVTTRYEPRVAIRKRVDPVIMQIKKTPEEDLEKAGKILSLALKQADQLKRYRETVDDIEKQTSSAHTCYDNYQKKGQQALNNPLSIGDCDKSYFQVQSLLGKARTISQERDFPESSWLYDEKLPGVRDGRNSLQDEETKQLQDILQGLTKIAEKAVTIQKQAARLQDYHGKLQGLDAAISENKRCYSAFYDEAKKEGVESVDALEAAMKPCNEGYTQVQAKLGEAQKLARESDFSGADVLVHFELPNLRDGFESSQDPETQKYWQELAELTKAKDGTADVIKEDSEEAQKLDVAVAGEIDSVVNATLHNLVRFVALHEVKNGASAEAAMKAAKEHGNMFIQELLKKSDEISDGAIKDLTERQML